jgi:hypothetical protein
MATEAEFRVTWEEFHAILRIGGDAGSHWAAHALKNAKRLANILGDKRAAELIVLIESHSQVLLAPMAGSRVSQSRQPKTVPSPPPSFPSPLSVPQSVPLPFPPPLSRAPPKIEVATHPLSPNAHKAKPARVFTHSRPAWDVDPTLLPKRPPGK